MKLCTSELVNLPAVRSVAAIELSRLGDVVEILPALQNFKQRFPSARVHSFVRQEYTPLLELCAIDLEVHAVRSDRLTAIGSAVREVRHLHPDLALSLSPSRRNALVTLLSGAPVKAGYLQYSRSLTPFLDSREVEVLGARASNTGKYDRENIAERSAKVFRALGISSPGGPFPVSLRKKPADEIRSRLMQRGTLPRGSYVAIHPFSAWEYRRWPLSNFVDLATRIPKELSLNATMICQPGDVDRLRSALAGRFADVHLAVTDNCAELAVAIGGASLFIGNDSGPLHVAGLLGIPTVGIFGPADPLLTGPPNSSARYLFRAVPCSPCDQTRCIRPDDPCMRQYSVDDVLACIKELPEASVTHDAIAHA